MVPHADIQASEVPVSRDDMSSAVDRRAGEDPVTAGPVFGLFTVEAMRVSVEVMRRGVAKWGLTQVLTASRTATNTTRTPPTS
jgi:hypothetical protein